jgi:hypothetical protein
MRLSKYLLLVLKLRNKYFQIIRFKTCQCIFKLSEFEFNFIYSFLKDNQPTSSASNKTIKNLNLPDNPFEKLDLTGIGKIEKMKPNLLTTNAFDINMAKIFEPQSLHIYGTNFEGLKMAKVRSVMVGGKAFTEVQHITHLFSVLNGNKNILSLWFGHGLAKELSIEVCKQLKINKTLKRVDIMYTPFETETSYKMLCEVIETNNTLESIIHDGTFGAAKENGQFEYFSCQPLLEALKKNTTLKQVNFYRLHCKDWEVEDVLKVNKLIVFDELADRTRGSRASQLNKRNRQNQEKRIGAIKCNVMSLARSHISRALPLELWQLIMEELQELNFDYFELYKNSLRK